VEERVLLERLRAGDEQAFEALVAEHDGALRRVARTLVRTQAVADEVVQDTWLSVVRGLDAFEGRSSLRTWIFRILVNSAKTRSTRERRTVPFSALKPEGSDRSFDPDHLVDDTPTWGGAESRPAHPEQRVLSREAIDHTLRAIHELPDGQRRVIAMRDVHGCSSDEVCAVLGISSGNQRVQLHRARAKVRRELEGYFEPAMLQAS
jgi:RNA polymerase sigma-70 factor, ECF subfamily